MHLSLILLQLFFLQNAFARVLSKLKNPPKGWKNSEVMFDFDSPTERLAIKPLHGSAKLVAAFDPSKIELEVEIHNGAMRFENAKGVFYACAGSDAVKKTKHTITSDTNVNMVFFTENKKTKPADLEKIITDAFDKVPREMPPEGSVQFAETTITLPRPFSRSRPSSPPPSSPSFEFSFMELLDPTGMLSIEDTPSEFKASIKEDPERFASATLAGGKINLSFGNGSTVLVYRGKTLLNRSNYTITTGSSSSYEDAVQNGDLLVVFLSKSGSYRIDTFEPAINKFKDLTDEGVSSEGVPTEEIPGKIPKGQLLGSFPQEIRTEFRSLSNAGHFGFVVRIKAKTMP